MQRLTSFHFLILYSDERKFYSRNHNCVDNLSSIIFFIMLVTVIYCEVYRSNCWMILLFHKSFKRNISSNFYTNKINISSINSSIKLLDNSAAS